MTVAVTTPTYGMERVSYMIPSRRHRYIRLHRIPLQWWDSRGTFFDQTPIVIGPKVDLVHTFNQIAVNRDFVVTAEMELPRYLGGSKNWQMSVGLKYLASDRCRGIWPLSEAARSYITRRFDAAGYGFLSEKVAVFRGAVTASANAGHDRKSVQSATLKLLFVGGDGLRKGLRPTLEAVQSLRRGGIDVQITVVGRPEAESYIVPGARFPTTDLDAMLAGEKWIRHFSSLPNAKVRHLMECHDLFVLPTMDESLGWVFAEASISGLPTVTTNIFAIPELVLNGITGWTIDVQLDEDRRWAYIGRADARDAWEAQQAVIIARLIAILAAAAEDRSQIADFGERARRHIAARYGADVAGAHLESLYAAATR